MLKTTTPYRLSATSENKHLGRNQLMEIFPTNIQEHLGDIIRDDALLRTAYVSRRYDPVSRNGMNYEDKGQFGDNQFSRWDITSRKWVPAPPPQEMNDLRVRLSQVIDDKAEIHLILELLRLANHISHGSVQPADRLLFIQAGIGSGKTTLLHHFIRIVAPEFNSRKLVSMNFIPVVVDLNNYDDGSDVAELWPKVLACFQEKLAAAAGIEDTEGWHRIARPDIYRPNGDLRPEVGTAPDRERAILQIVNKSADPTVYIGRLARMLFAGERPSVIVLLLDNLDRQMDAGKQAQIISRFHSLLAQTVFPLGVSAVREHSLGNLGHVEAFRAFFHVNRMHMTAPVIGEVVHKRFEICLRELSDGKNSLRTLRIQKNVVVGPLHVEGIIRAIAAAFAAETHGAEVARGQLDRTTCDPEHRVLVAELLNQITNSNGRASLGLVLEAVRSWALQHEALIIEYLYQRDSPGLQMSDRTTRREGKVRLPSFNADELLRLAFVGEYTYYDHEKSPHVFNLFCRGTEKPQPAAGRIPALYTYRLFQYFDVVGGRSTLPELFAKFRCFGYQSGELEETLADLMSGGFLESPEGSDLRKAQVIFSTRKLDFYLHKLSKMLVYLENVRNDSTIEYESRPHDVRSAICDDFYEVLKFIAYIAEQEMAEYRFVKDSRRECVEEYHAIATVEPVSWKLLKSVCKRSNRLYRTRPELFGRWSEWSPTDVGLLFAETRRGIVRKGEKDQIWPRVPKGESIRVTLDWDHAGG